MSYECMRFLAQQAVQLQRRMKDYALKSGGGAVDASAAAAAAQLSQPPIIVRFLKYTAPALSNPWLATPNGLLVNKFYY